MIYNKSPGTEALLIGPDTKIALFILGISQLLFGVPPLRYGCKRKFSPVVTFLKITF